MNGTEDASARLLNHFLTIQMLLQGRDLEAPLKETIREEQELLKEKVEEFRSRLYDAQQNEKQLNQEAFHEISGKDIFEAAQFQHDHIARTQEALKSVAETMENSIICATQELAEKKVLNASLNQDLRHLTRELKNHTYSFQGGLNQIGQRLPSYISHSMQGTLHEYQSSTCPSKT